MFPVPTSLSPSRVDSFLSCPLAFRFASIERLPEPPSPHTTKGSLVHRALEMLFTLPATQRTRAAADQMFDAAEAEYRQHPDFTGLGLDPAAASEFFADGRVLTHAYFDMEDPTAVHPIGIELRLEAMIGDLTIRGVIDRLELDATGQLVITDYKTGRAPSPAQQADRFAGLQFYAYMCEQVLGQRPAAVRLMYLRSGTTLTATPTGSSLRFVTNRATAVWQALDKACTSGDFRPKPSGLCSFCAFKDWCPEFGGDPALAAVEAPRKYAAIAV